MALVARWFNVGEDFSERTAEAPGPRRDARRGADLRAITAEVLANLRARYPHRWILDVGIGDPSVAWEESRAVRLLQLMLVHALVRGSKDAPITLSWWGEGGEVVIEVEHDARHRSRPVERALALAQGIAQGLGGLLTGEEQPWARG